MRFWRAELRRKLYEKIGSDYFAAGELRDTFLNVIREDLQSAASCITIPTLLIWGSAYKTTPLSDGERLSKIIKNSTLKVIPGAGHFVHRERPAEVAEMIRRFI